MENKYTLEEYDPTYLAKINFTVSSPNFSAAGYFNKFKKEIKTWATSPTKFKKKDIKKELENFLALQNFV